MEIGDYDEVARDSDNDLADAYGIALMQDVANEVRPRDNSKMEIHDRYDLPEFESDGNGGMRRKYSGDTITNIQQDSVLFGMMFGNKGNG